MDIQVIQSRKQNSLNAANYVEPVIRKIFPEFRSMSLPSWLISGEPLHIFEKEGSILLAYLWQCSSDLGSAYSLIQLKMKWEQFFKSFDERNKVIFVVVGENIPVSIPKLFSDVDFEFYELLIDDEANRIFVRQPTQGKEEVSASAGAAITEKPVSYGNKEPIKNISKQDTLFSSFFYKMGKLSEEELTRFLELEFELNQLGLSH